MRRPHPTNTKVTPRSHQARTRPCSAVSEHLAERLLLVGSDASVGFEVDLEARVDGIVPEVVFLHERVVHVCTRLFHVFNLAKPTSPHAVESRS